MNIFFLDGDPKECAKMHTNRHVVKMIIEYAQILSLAHCKFPNPQNKEWMFWIYKTPKGYNPKPLQWVCEDLNNYIWLGELAQALVEEYKFRYNKTHASTQTVDYFAKHYPSLPKIAMTAPSLSINKTPRWDPVMDEKQWVNTKVKANREFLKEVILYRRYYLSEKTHLTNWGNRNKPIWYTI